MNGLRRRPKTDQGRTIAVMSWYDIFAFDQAATMHCPDCEQPSPEIRDVWEAVRWAWDHLQECPA